MNFLSKLNGLDIKYYSFTGNLLEEGSSGFPRVETKLKGNTFILVIKSGVNKVKHDGKVYVLLGESTIQLPTGEYTLQGVYVSEKDLNEAKSRLTDVWFTKYAKVVGNRVVLKACGDINAHVTYTVDGYGWVMTQNGDFKMRDWTVVG